VDQKEIIRREYFLNRKSMREIAKELHQRPPSPAVYPKSGTDGQTPLYGRRAHRGFPRRGGQIQFGDDAENLSEQISLLTWPKLSIYKFLRTGCPFLPKDTKIGIYGLEIPCGPVNSHGLCRTLFPMSPSASGWPGDLSTEEKVE
jgi:hypothetical protein